MDCFNNKYIMMKWTFAHILFFIVFGPLERVNMSNYCNSQAE